MTTQHQTKRSGKLPDCEGHPAGENDQMGKTVYCDGSCKTGRETIYFNPEQIVHQSIVRTANDWAKERGLVVRRIDWEQSTSRWAVVVEGKL